MATVLAGSAGTGVIVGGKGDDVTVKVGRGILVGVEVFVGERVAVSIGVAGSGEEVGDIIRVDVRVVVMDDIAG